ncbi:MAG: hypothetical protein J5689_02865 [Clostridia bacterium]|nr:hypothetical protein [Clostridia bacterium]
MKKGKNNLLTWVIAIMLLTIISTTAVGFTYAKFVSQISSGGRVQSAGFLITGGSIDVNATVALVAPGETKQTSTSVSYFSQVVTDITAATPTITGTGVFTTSNWSSLLTAYKATTAGASDSLVTTSTTLADVFDVTIGNGTSSTLAEDFASAVAAASSGSVTALSSQISAMPANATQSITVPLNVKITWNEISNSFDTFVGNKVAERLQDSNISAAEKVSYINASLPLTATQHTSSSPSPSLASTSWMFNATPNTSALADNTTYAVNFTSNGENFVGIEKGSLYYVKADTSRVKAYDDNDGWTNEAYRTIQVTGGTDASNNVLSGFVSSNGLSVQNIYKHSIVYSDTSFGLNSGCSMDIYTTFSDLLTGDYIYSQNSTNEFLWAETSQLVYQEGFHNEPHYVTLQSPVKVEIMREYIEYNFLCTISGTNASNGTSWSNQLQNMNISSDTVTQIL